MDIKIKDENDIQGLLKRAYKDLPCTYYIMLEIVRPADAKKWMGVIEKKLTPASAKSPFTNATQIAFTYHGIRKIMPVDKLEEPFSREFTEGINEPVRSRILGDMNENHPDKWDWNGSRGPQVDVMLMIFAKDEGELRSHYNTLAQEYSAMGLKEIIKLDTTTETGEKEHFGFRDGMAQPFVKGFEANAAVTKEVGDHDMIMPGEFIFDYENEYGKKPISPTMKLAPKNGSNTGAVDIGKNGSYLIFRQLEQDVKKFWKFMFDTAANDHDFTDKDAVYIASKMMGRWPNGNPLHLADNANVEPLPGKEINNFLFKEKDEEGFGCPIGSHIRKSNPRDGIDSDPVASVQVSKRHRILRRGRPYGKPLAQSMLPADMVKATDEGKRGLYFICFNTNISRQFEFISHTWNNNPKFDGLYNDIDPVMGFPFLEEEYTEGQFTIQACPVRKKVKDIPQFVYVKGGAYFFMPSISTVRFFGEVEIISM